MELFQIDLLKPVSGELSDWLSQEEKARAQALRFEHLQHRYIVAHAALRYVLSRYLMCAPSAVAFVHNEWGKPRVEGGPYFNLSHSDDQAVIAVDRDRETGIDLETGSLELSMDEMDQVLSCAELAESRSRILTGADLLRLWVRKESVLKALGKGVSHDPRQITVGFGPLDFDCWREIHAVDEGRALTFQVLDISLGGSTCAVARRDEPLPGRLPVPRSWLDA